jgi:hypothetical protein
MVMPAVKEADRMKARLFSFLFPMGVTAFDWRGVGDEADRCTAKSRVEPGFCILRLVVFCDPSRNRPLKRCAFVSTLQFPECRL